MNKKEVFILLSIKYRIKTMDWIVRIIFW
jgi:hypothetical protein